MKTEREQSGCKAVERPVQDRAIKESPESRVLSPEADGGELRTLNLEPRTLNGNGGKANGEREPDRTRRRPKSLSRSILPVLAICAWLLTLGAQGATVTGTLGDIGLSGLQTKITFTPTNVVLIAPGFGLSAGPAVTIDSTNDGSFSVVLDAGDYTVKLPLVPWRSGFGISVPRTNGTINITNLLSGPKTYTYTSSVLAATTDQLVAVSNALNFAAARTLYVDPNGSDSNPGTLLLPFKTITNAIAHMGISNTLNILTGTYNIGTNKMIPPMGYTIDGHGSLILSDPDDGDPKLRVADNCTAFNLTLQCTSNILSSLGTGLFWGGVGNWNDNGAENHLDPPATNFYYHHIHIHNALSDGFYIGNTDYTNRYQGKIENCDGEGMFDMISVGGRTNSAITFENCDFFSYQDPINQTAAFFRTTGGTLNLIGVNYTVTNVTASNPGQPFVMLNDGSTRVFIDGGRYTLYNKPGQGLTAQWYSATLNGGYMSGRFLMSTNGTGWYELAPGISNRWTTLPLNLLTFGGLRTNINASTSLFLSFQAIPSAGSGTMGFILKVSDAGVTNTYWTSAYASAAAGDIAALSFSHIPLNPNAVWWYDVDPNTTSSSLFGNISLDAIASTFSAYYLYNDGGSSASGVVVNTGGTLTITGDASGSGVTSIPLVVSNVRGTLTNSITGNAATATLATHLSVTDSNAIVAAGRQATNNSGVTVNLNAATATLAASATGAVIATNLASGVSITNATIDLRGTQTLRMLGPNGGDGFIWKWFSDRLELSNHVFLSWMRFNDGLQISDSSGNQTVGFTGSTGNGSVSGTMTAAAFSGSGAGLTSLTAANLAGSGTLPDGVLSANVPLIGSVNTFTKSNTFKGLVLQAPGNATQIASLGYLATGEVVTNAVPGYVIPLFNTGNNSYSANTTYYVGRESGRVVNTTYGIAQIDIPKAGTIKRVSYKWDASSTLGSGEVANFWIEINNSTDIANFQSPINVAFTNKIVSGLSQSVAVGDTIVLKITTPSTWGTPATAVRYQAQVYIE